VSSRWDALLEVQGHDTTIDQLEHRRRTLPERARLDEVMAAIGEVHAEAERVEAERHELGRAQQRLEDDVHTLAEKVTRSEATLYGGTVSNPRELQALQDEIGALKRRISQLEDEELEQMVAAEPLDARSGELSTTRAALDAEASSLTAAVAEAEVAIDAELVEHRAARDAAASSVEPDLLAEYDHLRKQLGGVAIARFEGGSCLGCHLRLPAMEVDRIKHLPPDELVHCEECGRILAR
jgi:uncharacterized protein